MQFNIQEYEPSSANALKKSVVSLYRYVYALPPYNEQETGVQRFADSWEARTKMTGFRFVGAEDHQSILVGMAYGWQSVRGDPWNIKLNEQLGSLSADWLSDCFEFVDFAVAPDFQGMGLGKQLINKLFSGLKNKTAILLTHQTQTKAAQMYAKDGWVELKRDFEMPSGEMFLIMGKNLE